MNNNGEQLQNEKNKMPNNLTSFQFDIKLNDRIRQNGHNPLLIWITGLSGSGKSTLANTIEQRLFKQGIKTMILDGDNIRNGLNKNLGFSTEDRSENIRRIAETAKLFLESGTVVIASFISPLITDRANVKSIVGSSFYFEIFMDTSLETCEARDPKGLYQKARTGEIKNFTGISSPYETPINPDFIFNSEENTSNQQIDLLIKKLTKLITTNE